MAKVKTFSSREIQKILKANGFEYVSTNGDRHKYRRGNESLVINNNTNKMVFYRLVKEYNLTL